MLKYVQNVGEISGRVVAASEQHFCAQPSLTLYQTEKLKL